MQKSKKIAKLAIQNLAAIGQTPKNKVRCHYLLSPKALEQKPS
jgi:hypothetical protein